jgi:hypothetical protein
VAQLILAFVVAAGVSFYAGEKVGVRLATARAMGAPTSVACESDAPVPHATLPDGNLAVATESIGADCNTDYR